MRLPCVATTRRQEGRPVLEAFFVDFHRGARALRRRPIFALAAVVSLCVGIGASTTLFALANALLVRTVPGVTRPERLVEVAQHEFFDLPWHTVRELREERAVLEDLAALALIAVAIRPSATADPAVQGGLAVSGNYFDLLGVRPSLGRSFAPGEADYPRVSPVALVSDFYWRNHLDGARDAVGRVVQVNGVPVEVIGVLPPGFAGHHVGLLIDVFLPLGLSVPGLPSTEALNDVTGTSVQALGRLAPGLSPAAAEAALSSAGNRQRRALGLASQGELRAQVTRWGPLPANVRGGAGAFLALLWALVGLALTMACVNVTTVLFARALERKRELAVRQTLGATRGRLTRQLVAEAIPLFLLAGAAGTVATLWTSWLLRGFSPRLPLPGRTALELTVDWRVVAFALIFTLGIGVAFSLLPALRVGRLPPLPALKAGAGATASTTRTRRMLVATQVAAAALLLAAATVLARAPQGLEAHHLGWSADGVTVAALDLTSNGTDESRGGGLYRQLRERVGALPGVESVALATKLPLGGRSSFGPVFVPGEEPPAGSPGHEAFLNRVSPGYLRTLGIALLRGRDIADGDGSGAPLVAVVNETMARRLWRGRDPVGRRFQIGSGELANRFEVIGVAADTKRRGGDEVTPNFYYVPVAQFYSPEQILHVKARPDTAGGLAPWIRSVVRELDPTLPAPQPQAMTEALAIFFLPQRIAALTAAASGVFGLLLAAVGVYGVTAFLVTGRTREIGIRVALGGSRRDIVRLFLREAATAPLVGLLVGGAGGVAFAWLASRVLPGVDPRDPAAFAGTATVVVVVGALAVTLPVLRVLHRNPLAALRED